MKRLTLLLVFIALMCMSQVVLAQESPSNEIDRVEIGQNSRTVYYKDGHKAVYVDSSLDMHMSFEITSMITQIPSSPDWWAILVELSRTYIWPTVAFLASCVGAVIRFFRWLLWKVKYRKSRTPVVIR